MSLIGNDPFPSAGVLSHPRYRPDIDGLRAIAILAVVGFHAFPSWIPGGFVGVDVFFVISGFLISSIIFGGLYKGVFSFIEFYAHRVNRIFPALILVLIVCYVLGWFTLLKEEYAQLGKHIVGGAGFISNFLLWNESGYFDAAAETKPLLHLWSLGIEEQYYIFWPLLLWLTWKRHVKLLTAVSIILIASFAINIGTVSSHKAAAFYSPLSRAWELLTGGVLAYLQLHKSHLLERFQNQKSYFGILIILIALVLLGKNSLFPGWWALLPTVGTFLIISSGRDAWLNRNVLAHPLLVWFGLISYPLYLWHWPLLSFARIVEAETPTIEVRAAIVFISVLLAWLTYILIERPVRSRKSNNTINIALCILLAIVAGVGYDTYNRHGLGFRINHAISQYSAGSTDVGAAKNWRENVCFLNDEEIQFGSQCLEKGKGNLIFLWGDSHAASLYPGLKHLQGNYRFRIDQLTASGCPPMFTQTGQNTHCKTVNNEALSILVKEKPNIVVLQAEWGGQSLTSLPDTIRTIRSVTNAKIILVGPTPMWKDKLSAIYFVYWRKYHEILPARTLFGIDRKVAPRDKTAESMARQLGITYVSAYNIMCNQEGCLTRVGKGNGKIVVFDDSHLTTAASLFLISSMQNVLSPYIK